MLVGLKTNCFFSFRENEPTLLICKGAVLIVLFHTATISSIFTEIKEVIRAKGGDLGIFMSAMNGLGINISTIKLYDHYCYTPNQIEDYDCLLEHEGLGFPKLVNASLPNQITKVKYDLNLHTLERYRIKLKEI